MRLALILPILLFFRMTIAAQSQRVDVISYKVPNGWHIQQNEGGVQLSVADKQSGAYAIACVIKAKGSGASAKTNFDADWSKLVKGTVQVKEEPTMMDPERSNGWDVVSGTAHYTDGTQKGLVTLMTATGGGKTASIVLMTNTDRYKNEMLSFLNSIELAGVPKIESAVSTPGAHNASIVGLWVYYTIETSGYINGFPQPSGGYFRKEYAFYGDGTYLFRMKNWAVFVKEIQYVYEKGTWKLNGSKLTLTPEQGKGGWWAKAKSGKTNEWGGLARNGSWKLEPATYTMDLHYYAGTNETHLILQPDAPTEREGKQENSKQSYKPRALSESLIDNPPGLQTGFENKPVK